MLGRGKRWGGGRKLNDQLTGFVEIKLAEGIKGDGESAGGEDERWEGGQKQTITTVSPPPNCVGGGEEKLENEDVTGVAICCSRS